MTATGHQLPCARMTSIRFKGFFLSQAASSLAPLAVDILGAFGTPVVLAGSYAGDAPRTTCTARPSASNGTTMKRQDNARSQRVRPTHDANTGATGDTGRSAVKDHKPVPFYKEGASTGKSGNSKAGGAAGQLTPKD